MIQQKSLANNHSHYQITLQIYQKIQEKAHLVLQEQKASLIANFENSGKKRVTKIYDLNSFSFIFIDKPKNLIKLVFPHSQLQFDLVEQIYLKQMQSHFGKFFFQLNFFQKYQPIKKLGKGGFSTVYLIKNKQTGQKFAAKAYSKGSIERYKNGKQCLLNQINLMRCCENKHILKLISIYQQESAFYAILELVQGDDLFSRIKKHKQQQLKIKMIMNQLLKGLKHLHQKKIIHRDLKPSNIFFKNDNHLVIGDFGLATSLQQEKYLIGKCGTPGYAAPELLNLKEKQGLTTASDIFSVGVIFYELLTGKKLFQGDSVNQILQLNRQGIYKLQGVDSQAKQLLHKMLDMNPSKRPSATHLLKHEYLSKQEIVSSTSLDQQNIPPKQSIQTKGKKYSHDIEVERGVIHKSLIQKQN